MKIDIQAEINIDNKVIVDTNNINNKSSEYKKIADNLDNTTIQIQYLSDVTYENIKKLSDEDIENLSLSKEDISTVKLLKGYSGISNNEAYNKTLFEEIKGNPENIMAINLGFIMASVQQNMGDVLGGHNRESLNDQFLKQFQFNSNDEALEHLLIIQDLFQSSSNKAIEKNEAESIEYGKKGISSFTNMVDRFKDFANNEKQISSTLEREHNLNKIAAISK